MVCIIYAFFKKELSSLLDVFIANIFSQSVFFSFPSLNGILFLFVSFDEQKFKK